jgi:hypothetical protein
MDWLDLEHGQPPRGYLDPRNSFDANLADQSQTQPNPLATASLIDSSVEPSAALGCTCESDLPAGHCIEHDAFDVSQTASYLLPMPLLENEGGEEIAGTPDERTELQPNDFSPFDLDHLPLVTDLLHDATTAPIVPTGECAQPSNSHTDPKQGKKIHRILISATAKHELNAHFDTNPYPLSDELDLLASRTGLSYQTCRV